MKRRLLVLLVAAVCAAAGTLSHAASPGAQRVAAPLADDVVQSPDGGWWDWH
jgi:hypothetical protein